MSFELARQVADTILYEGYVLYPYRASSQKNRHRWQFGVLVPRAWSEAGSGEPWFSQTDCILEPGDAAELKLKLRFLQAQAKTVEAAGPDGAFRPVASLEVGDAVHVTWDEGVAQEIDAMVTVADLLGAERTTPIETPVEIPAWQEVEALPTAPGQPAARIIRERWPISAALRVAAERLDGPYGIVRVRIQVENLTTWGDPDAGREEASRRSLLTAHLLIGVDDGAFVSLLEPPEWARPAVAACDNIGTWPVLIGAGRRDLILSSPIILYDYPQTAPESPGDLFDATEIDEILTLRTMTLTDAEKREARATDDRAAAILDRVEAMPPELLDRLHGTIRYLRDVTGPAQAEPSRAPWAQPETPWWDPAADASVDPDTDSVLVGGTAVARGSRVVLRPGLRRADAQDMFLAGRVATVEAVLFDIENAAYVAVSLADDPDSDLFATHGRFLYFAPDEIEPLGPSGVEA